MITSMIPASLDACLAMRSKLVRASFICSNSSTSIDLTPSSSKLVCLLACRCGGTKPSPKRECLGPGKNRGIFLPWTTPRGAGGVDSVHATNRSQSFPGGKLTLGASGRPVPERLYLADSRGLRLLPCRAGNNFGSSSAPAKVAPVPRDLSRESIGNTARAISHAPP